MLILFRMKPIQVYIYWLYPGQLTSCSAVLLTKGYIIYNHCLNRPKYIWWSQKCIILPSLTYLAQTQCIMFNHFHWELKPATCFLFLQWKTKHHEACFTLNQITVWLQGFDWWLIHSDIFKQKKWKETGRTQQHRDSSKRFFCYNSKIKKEWVPMSLTTLPSAFGSQYSSDSSDALSGPIQ